MKLFKRNKKKNEKSASNYFSGSEQEKSNSIKKKFGQIFGVKRKNKAEKSSASDSAVFRQNRRRNQNSILQTSSQMSSQEPKTNFHYPNLEKENPSAVHKRKQNFQKIETTLSSRTTEETSAVSSPNNNTAIVGERKKDGEEEAMGLPDDFIGNAMLYYKMAVENVYKAKSGDARSIVIIISFVSCLLIVLGFLQPFIHAISACAYPAYMSFKALNTDDVDDDRKWLVYWTVYGTIRIAEPLVYPFLRHLPYFPIIELFFLVWLYHDSTNGANLLYEHYIRPALEKHEEKIDKGLKSVDSAKLMKKLMRS